MDVLQPSSPSVSTLKQLESQDRELLVKLKQVEETLETAKERHEELRRLHQPGMLYSILGFNFQLYCY